MQISEKKEKTYVDGHGSFQFIFNKIDFFFTISHNNLRDGTHALKVAKQLIQEKSKINKQISYKVEKAWYKILLTSDLASFNINVNL